MYIHDFLVALVRSFMPLLSALFRVKISSLVAALYRNIFAPKYALNGSRDPATDAIVYGLWAEIICVRIRNRLAERHALNQTTFLTTLQTYFAWQETCQWRPRQCRHSNRPS